MTRGPVFIVITYLTLCDSILWAARWLERIGRLAVTYYPLMLARKTFSDEDKLVADFTRFMREDSVVQRASSIHVLWWYIDVPLAILERMHRACGKHSSHYLYSWDDPHAWTSRLAESELDKKSHLFDVCFSCCETSCAKYVQHGARSAVHLLPGFEPSVHNAETELAGDKTVANVVLCCTNMYQSRAHYPNQLGATRYEYVQAIADYLRREPSKFTFAIYGPPQVGEDFPEFYEQELSYADTSEVYRHADVVLCTHVDSSGTNYLSERVILTMGSGGVVLMDNIPQNIVTDQQVYFIDNELPICQTIEAILCDTTGARTAKRKAAYNLAVQKFTWAHWATTVLYHAGVLDDYRCRIVELSPCHAGPVLALIEAAQHYASADSGNSARRAVVNAVDTASECAWMLSMFQLMQPSFVPKIQLLMNLQKANVPTTQFTNIYSGASIDYL